MKFSRSDESQTVRFQVKPAPSTAPGEFQVRAVASANGKTFDRGFQVIEYPHIRRYHIYDTAHTTLKVIDVRTPANLTIGYVMGVGDQVPPAIEQLGAKVEMITADDLAWGNLSRFDAIVTGVRAYERRDDLRANNSRLLEYVFNGGTVIVQYNKFEFNDAQYGPYPAKVSSNRVTDEDAPVKILDGARPGVHDAERDRRGGVEELGAGARAVFPRREGFALPRPRAARGSVSATTRARRPARWWRPSYGKGRWVYVGLNLWRQLPSGTDGAYQLLANLISLGKTARAKLRIAIADCRLESASAIRIRMQFMMEVP